MQTGSRPSPYGRWRALAARARLNRSFNAFLVKYFGSSRSAVWYFTPSVSTYPMMGAGGLADWAMRTSAAQNAIDSRLHLRPIGAPSR